MEISVAPRRSWQLMLVRGLAAAVFAFACALHGANAQGQREQSVPDPHRSSVGAVLPAGTTLRIHVNAPLSSSESKTGQQFTFTAVDALAVNGTVIVQAGAQGNGTVVLAGPAGTGGHEGDLTLRLDDLTTSDGNEVSFQDERIRVNGRNRKAASSLIGLVPIVGIAGRAIRGDESRVEPSTALRLTLSRPAVVGAATGSASRQGR